MVKRITTNKGKLNTIRFGMFTIIIQEDKVNKFIKKLSKLCDKYQAEDKGTFYSYKVEG